jgi:hypothetical protein
METLEVKAMPEGDETTEACPCCGRPIYEGRGVLTSADHDLADYWYRWSEGHEGRFDLAVSPCDDAGAPRGGVAVLSARLEAGNIIYLVVEPEDSPWKGTATAPVLRRAQALDSNLMPDLFALVDAIAANDRRLSKRISECGHVA